MSLSLWIGLRNRKYSSGRALQKLALKSVRQFHAYDAGVAS